MTKSARNKAEDNAGVRFARQSLVAYIIAHWPGYKAAKVHRFLAKKLEEALTIPNKRIIINMPPRHGKSMMATENFPAFYLGHLPEKQVAICTYSQSLATRFGRKVRDKISTAIHKATFPESILSTANASNKEFGIEEGGEFRAVGVGGPLTGTGADLLIIDDPTKNRQEADSAIVRERLKEWYESTAYTRLMPNGSIIIIQTRWHEDDLSGWLIASHGHEDWEIISLPAICDNLNDPLGRKIGEALWPEQLPLSALNAIKRSVGEREWSSLYQQNPSILKGKIFNKEWWSEYDELPSSFIRIIQSWDTAFKVGDQDDYSACTTWGVTSEGYYLIDVYKDKLKFPELKKKVKSHAIKFNCKTILIEDKASGQSLIQELARGSKLNITPINPGIVSKEGRAMLVTPIIEDGGVFIPKEAPWLDSFMAEITSFPSAKHDDVVDTVVQAINYLKGRFRLDLTRSQCESTIDIDRYMSDEDDDDDDEQESDGIW